MLKLEFTTGSKAGKVLTVNQKLTIGRSQENDLFLPDPQVSRFHAEIRRENEAYWAEDCGSYNGTLVNDIRIERKSLRNGDLVKLGGTELKVILPERKEYSSARLLVTREMEGTPPLLTRDAETMALPNMGQIGLDDYLKAIGLPTVDNIPGDPSALDRHSQVLRQAQQFAVLYDVAKSLNQQQALDEIARTSLNYIFKIFKTLDTAHMVLVEPETRELVPFLSRDREREVEGDIQISKTIIQQVVNSKMALITADAETDERFSQSKSVMMYGLHSLLCVPMISMGNVVGLIQIERSDKVTGFSEEDMFLMTVLASLSAVAIENNRLLIKQKKTIEELQEAQRALMDTQEQLIEQERLASVGQLASGIAHEIKNMLSPIMLADMIRQRYPDDEVVQEYADLILESHKRILALTKEVKLFSSGEGEKYSMVPYSLKRLADSVVGFLRYDREVKRTRIGVEAEADPEPLLDPDKMKQVLINLLRNAAQAVDPRDGTVTLRIGRDGNKAFIEVIDNGEGISEDQLDSIWKPFFTTKKDVGTGLGLHISRMIVERHSGELTCTSTLGRGTTFRLTIPLSSSRMTFPSGLSAAPKETEKG